MQRREFLQELLAASVYLIKGRRSVLDAAHPLNMSQVDLGPTDRERQAGLDKLKELYLADAQREVGRVQAKDWPEAVKKVNIA